MNDTATHPYDEPIELLRMELGRAEERIAQLEAHVARVEDELTQLNEEREAGWPIMSIDGRYVLTGVWAKEQKRAEKAEAELARLEARATRDSHDDA